MGRSLRLLYILIFSICHSVSTLPAAPSSPPESADSQGLFDLPEQKGHYSIDDLTASALEKNRDLLQLHVEEEKSMIDLRSAKANRFPTVEGEISVSHIANPLDPISVTAGEFGTFNLGGEEVLLPTEDMVLYDGMDPMLYSFGVTVEQPIFTWGKIRNSIELYTRVVETQRLNIEKKKQELSTTITIIVYSLFYLQRIEDLVSQQKESAERLVYISEESYKNGFITYGDLLEARIQAREIDLAEHRLTEQREQALLDLEQVTMIDDLEYGDIDFTAVDDKLDNYLLQDRDELMAAAARNNRDLQLLQSMKNVADYKLKITEGKSYLKPDIGLRFRLSYGGSRFPFIETGWFGEDDYNLFSTLAFTTTLFDGGKLKSEIALSREELKAAGYDYEKGLQSVEKFLTETLLKLQLNRSNIEYYTLKLENSREQTALSKTQFDAGAGQESDYLMKLISRYGDEITLYQETVMFFTNYFTLMNVACGG